MSVADAVSEVSDPTTNAGLSLQPMFSDDDLARALDALSHPVRLAIVRALEEPRCLSEIGISPSARGRAGVVRGEVLSRQTVKQHIERLSSAGIVVTNSLPRKRGVTTQYVLDPQALMLISEAFQQMTCMLATGRHNMAPPTHGPAIPEA